MSELKKRPSGLSGRFMADYHSLLMRAVANLPSAATPATRQAIYGRARKALLEQLRSLRPPLPESDIGREERALDAAIAQIEARFGPQEERPLTDEEGEVRELTLEDFRAMRPVREVMPELIEAMADFRRKVGRPKAVAPKVHVGFRLAADVVASIKASGPGYNARVEQALRAAGFGEPAAKKRRAREKV